MPREVVEKWLAYFRAELPAVAFKCSTQKQAQNLSQRRTIPGGKGAKKRGNQAPSHHHRTVGQLSSMQHDIAPMLAAMPRKIDGCDPAIIGAC